MSLTELGRFADAAGLAAEVVHLAEARHHAASMSLAYGAAGLLRLLKGNVTREDSLPGWAAYAQHLLGDIATHLEDFDAEHGESHYLQALALAEPRGMRPLVVHCHLGLGKLYRRTGEREQTLTSTSPPR